jgi:hypothetical protein
MANKTLKNSFTFNSVKLFKKYQKPAFSLLLAFGFLVTANIGLSLQTSAAAGDILFINEGGATPGITQSPQPDGITAGDKGLLIYNSNNSYKLTVTDARIANGSICDFRIKEVSVVGNETTPPVKVARGYEALTKTILTSSAVTADNLGYNTTTKTYQVKKSAAGANITIAGGSNRAYQDYDLEIRCTSGSDVYGRDQKINFLFGAYSVVDISGVTA